MCLRLFYSILLVVAVLSLGGCKPPSDSQVDDRNNEFLRVGQQRVSAQDYTGAMEMFEKALEANPRSVLGHFELAMLYEQHSAQKESDYVNAMYHYQQAIRFRPNEYPADLSRQRINACKRELVKAESLAPVAQSLIREFDRLKEENTNLKKQIEGYKAQLSARPPTPAPLGNPPLPSSGVNTGNTEERTGTPRITPPTISGTRVTPLPPAAGKSHTVQPRETLYGISKKYGVRMNAILTANPSVNPNRLKPGQVLVIP